MTKLFKKILLQLSCFLIIFFCINILVLNKSNKPLHRVNHNSHNSIKAQEEIYKFNFYNKKNIKNIKLYFDEQSFVWEIELNNFFDLEQCIKIYIDKNSNDLLDKNDYIYKINFSNNKSLQTHSLYTYEPKNIYDVIVYDHKSPLGSYGNLLGVKEIKSNNTLNKNTVKIKLSPLAINVKPFSFINQKIVLENYFTNESEAAITDIKQLLNINPNIDYQNLNILDKKSLNKSNNSQIIISNPYTIDIPDYILNTKIIQPNFNKINNEEIKIISPLPSKDKNQEIPSIKINTRKNANILFKYKNSSIKNSFTENVYFWPMKLSNYIIFLTFLFIFLLSS